MMRGARHGPAIAVAVPWVLSAILVVLLGYLYFTESVQPLEFVNPQNITSTGPYSISAGDKVEIAGEKCNTANHAVSVMATSQWRRLDVRPQVVPDITDRPSTYAPRQGCGVPGVFANAIPDGVSPGIWQIEGVEVVTSGGEQTATWVTEAFEIIP